MSQSDDESKFNQILSILRDFSGRLDNLESKVDRIASRPSTAQDPSAEDVEPARDPPPRPSSTAPPPGATCPDPPPSPSSTISSSSQAIGDSSDEKSGSASASASASTSTSTSFSEQQTVFELRADEKVDDALSSCAWRSFQLRREPNADVMSTIDELKKVYADITRASAKWQRQMIKDLHVKNLRADVRRTKRGAVMIAIEAVRKYRASSKRLSSDKREFLGMVEHYVDGVHNAIFKQPRNCWYLCATDGSRKVNLRCTGAWIANFQDNSLAWQEESHHAECYLVRNQTQLLELVQKLRTSDVWVIVKHPPSQFVLFQVEIALMFCECNGYRASARDGLRLVLPSLDTRKFSAEKPRGTADIQFLDDSMLLGSFEAGAPPHVFLYHDIDFTIGLSADIEEPTRNTMLQFCTQMGYTIALHRLRATSANPDAAFEKWCDATARREALSKNRDALLSHVQIESDEKNEDTRRAFPLIPMLDDMPTSLRNTVQMINNTLFEVKVYGQQLVQRLVALERQQKVLSALKKKMRVAEGAMINTVRGTQIRLLYEVQIRLAYMVDHFRRECLVHPVLNKFSRKMREQHKLSMEGVRSRVMAHFQDLKQKCDDFVVRKTENFRRELSPRQFADLQKKMDNLRFKYRGGLGMDGMLPEHCQDDGGQSVSHVYAQAWKLYDRTKHKYTQKPMCGQPLPDGWTHFKALTPQDPDLRSDELLISETGVEHGPFCMNGGATIHVGRTKYNIFSSAERARGCPSMQWDVFEHPFQYRHEFPRALQKCDYYTGKSHPLENYSKLGPGDKLLPFFCDLPFCSMYGVRVDERAYYACAGKWVDINGEFHYCGRRRIAKDVPWDVLWGREWGNAIEIPHGVRELPQPPLSDSEKEVVRVMRVVHRIPFKDSGNCSTQYRVQREAALKCVLGVPRGYSFSEKGHQRFRQIRVLVHPDRHTTTDFFKYAERAFTAVQEAWDELSALHPNYARS